MTAHHELSDEAFAALSSGAGGASAVAELTAAELSKHIILLQGVVQVARETGHRQYAQAREGYELLATAARADRAAAERVIRHPPVAVWARRTILACRNGLPAKGAEPARLRAVGAAAAIRANLDTSIDVPAVNGRVMLPSLGEATVPGESALVRTALGNTAVGPVRIPSRPGTDTPGWAGLRQVSIGTLHFLLEDRDPYRMPELTDLVVGTPVADWDDIFRATWPLLLAHQPGSAAEISNVVTAVIPRARPRMHTISTSSSGAYGAVAMSLPPDPVACAETLVHEVQHLKLAAIQDLVRLALPDDGRLFYAPWRPDPRPVSGLLQGTYAYLGVTAFWRRQRHFIPDQLRAHTEYAHWRESATAAVRTLEDSGLLTPAGSEFVGGMARVLHSWRHEPVPLQALRQARRAILKHQSRWETAHGPVSAD